MRNIIIRVKMLRMSLFLFSFGFLVSGQQLVIMEKANRAIFYLQHDAFADHMVGKQEPVGVVRNLTVPIDRAKYLKRGIVVPGRQQSQMSYLLLPPLADRLPIRAVNPLVGHRIEPLTQISIGFFNGLEPISAPEAFPDIIDGSFHFTLNPRTVGRTSLGRKAVVSRKIDDLRIEIPLTGFVGDDHMAHIVIEDLSWYATEVMETGNMAVHETLETTALDKTGEHRPAEAEHQRKQIDEKTGAIADIANSQELFGQQPVKVDPDSFLFLFIAICQKISVG